jgi:hypothetical protein
MNEIFGAENWAQYTGGAIARTGMPFARPARNPLTGQWLLPHEVPPLEQREAISAQVRALKAAGKSWPGMRPTSVARTPAAASAKTPAAAAPAKKPPAAAPLERRSPPQTFTWPRCLAACDNRKIWALIKADLLPLPRCRLDASALMIGAWDLAEMERRGFLHC